MDLYILDIYYIIYLKIPNLFLSTPISNEMNRFQQGIISLYLTKAYIASQYIWTYELASFHDYKKKKSQTLIGSYSEKNTKISYIN